jgi:hypothetical protein
MIIFDSVVVAEAKNHWIGGQIIKIESDRPNRVVQRPSPPRTPGGGRNRDRALLT